MSNPIDGGEHLKLEVITFTHSRIRPPDKGYIVSLSRRFSKSGRTGTGPLGDLETHGSLTLLSLRPP
jgi:hypothetical protein